MKKSAKQILFYVVLIAAVIAICVMLFKQSDVAMKYSDVVTAFKTGEVESFEIDKNNVISMTFKEETDFAKTFGTKGSDGKYYAEYRLASLSIFHADLGDDIEEQIAAGNLEGEYVAPTQYSAWLSYLPIILIVVSLIVMYIIMTRSISGGGGGGKMNSFAKSRAKMANPSDKDRVTFRDVAGADEEKEELEEVVEFLNAVPIERKADALQL